MEKNKRYTFFKRGTQAGISLLETMIACAILLILAAGILSMAVVATSTTETQGHLGARTAEYAQDKMEQLMMLAFGDQVSNTTVFPSAPAGGSGLLPGGSADPNTPVPQYVDYLDPTGNILGGNAQGWYYMRVWQVALVPGSVPTPTCPGATLKQITVTTVVRNDIGTQTAPVRSTVVALKACPF